MLVNLFQLGANYCVNSKIIYTYRSYLVFNRYIGELMPINHEHLI
jgi:hypothetical protein